MQLKQQLCTKQQLSLTPQLQEAIRLMQLSAMALRAEIEVLAESNPLITLEYDEVAPKEYEKIQINSPQLTFARDSYSSKVVHSFDEFSEDYAREEASEQSLQDILVSQLNQQPLSEDDEIIGLAIIDSLNDDGYLSLNCDEIVSILQDQEVSVNETAVERVLRLIQSFDPPGIGARHLAECLLLQLQRKPLPNKAVDSAKRILSQPINLLVNKDKKAIIKQSRLKLDEFEQGWRLIQSLDPRPGAAFMPVEKYYAVPDIIVRQSGSEWKVELNEVALPRVGINQVTLALLDKDSGHSHHEYRRQQLTQARWLISSLEKRQKTLLAVAEEIVEHQRAFLEHGPLAMRPLTLQYVAHRVGKHESTVSRITAHKTILTPHGLYELKHFFSSQLRSENGKGVSSVAICALIQRLVAEEDPKTPYSDNALSQILKTQGFLIARRTVAKYREALGLLSSNDRRAI